MPSHVFTLASHVVLNSSFFVRSARRFSVPTWLWGGAARSRRSRLAAGHRRRRARSGLEGGEHGARLWPVGARLILRPPAEPLLAYHHRPADARHLVGERTGDDLALLGFKQFHQPGIVFGAFTAQHRHRAIDQQPTQVAIAAFADRTELDPRLR